MRPAPRSLLLAFGSTFVVTLGAFVIAAQLGVLPSQAPSAENSRPLVEQASNAVPPVALASAQPGTAAAPGPTLTPASAPLETAGRYSQTLETGVGSVPAETPSTIPQPAAATPDAFDRIAAPGGSQGPSGTKLTGGGGGAGPSFFSRLVARLVGRGSAQGTAGSGGSAGASTPSRGGISAGGSTPNPSPGGQSASGSAGSAAGTNTSPEPSPVAPPAPAPDALPVPAPTPATTGYTWYVRPDGGSYGTTSTTCNGRTDFPYVVGNGPNCAVSHPFEILGINRENPRARRVAGGDTVIIKNGSYRMGAIPEVYDSGSCAASWTYDCYPLAIPSGLDTDHKTRIYGEGYGACTSRPELWGALATRMVLNLEGSSNVDIQCLDLTDHADCGGNSGNSCSPTELYGHTGIQGWQGANVSLQDVRIHGFAGSGALLGKQTDLSMRNVEIVGNGMAGLNQDNHNHPNDNSWSGTNTFTRLKISWNGCAENWPVDGGFNNCTDQNDTGYGDGWGSPNGGTGGSYVFLDSEFTYNTSDGLDLLYLLDANSHITIERTLFEGNVGNAVKLGTGSLVLRNNVIIANCNYWAGQPFTAPHLSTCRAGGNAVVLRMGAGSSLDAVNNTVTGESDILFAVAECSGGERISFVNNILNGAVQWNDPTDKASWFYGYNGCSDRSITTADSNLIHNVKQTNPCLGRHGCIDQAPQFVALDFATDRFDVRLQPVSPAIGAGLAEGSLVGTTSVPTEDFTGAPRGGTRVLGAYGFPR